MIREIRTFLIVAAISVVQQAFILAVVALIYVKLFGVTGCVWKPIQTIAFILYLPVALWTCKFTNEIANKFKAA